MDREASAVSQQQCRVLISCHERLIDSGLLPSSGSARSSDWSVRDGDAISLTCLSHQLASSCDLLAVSGQVEVLLVEDQESQRVNREFLGHDYPTDVITFALGAEPMVDSPGDPLGEPGRPSFTLEGSLVVNLELAIRAASELNWPVQFELLLYCVHGLLHLVGEDDQTDTARARMVAAERRVFSELGLTMPPDR